MTDRAAVFSHLTRLSGERVFLTPFSAADAPENFEAYLESREALRRFVPWENRSAQDVFLFAERAEKQRAAGQELHLAIRELSSGRMLGTIGAHHLDAFTPRGEIGYWIRTSAAGQGYASDAVFAFTAFLAGPAGLSRITAKVAVDNLASQRVLIKTGFTEKGFEPRGELCHGVWNDLKLYGKIWA